jgi:hypothetical protein
MRHSQPGEEKSLSAEAIHQVLEHLERANEKTYQGHDPSHFRDSRVLAEVP